jgi:L-rhamnose isomerase
MGWLKNWCGVAGLLEEVKTVPLGAVWDFYCLAAGVPVGDTWLPEIKRYENIVLRAR